MGVILQRFYPQMTAGWYSPTRPPHHACFIGGDTSHPPGTLLGSDTTLAPNTGLIRALQPSGRLPICTVADERRSLRLLLRFLKAGSLPGQSAAHRGPTSAAAWPSGRSLVRCPKGGGASFISLPQIAALYAAARTLILPSGGRVAPEDVLRLRLRVCPWWLLRSCLAGLVGDDAFFSRRPRGEPRRITEDALLATRGVRGDQRGTAGALDHVITEYHALSPRVSRGQPPSAAGRQRKGNTAVRDRPDAFWPICTCTLLLERLGQSVEAGLATAAMWAGRSGHRRSQHHPRALRPGAGRRSHRHRGRGLKTDRARSWAVPGRGVPPDSVSRRRYRGIKGQEALCASRTLLTPARHSRTVRLRNAHRIDIVKLHPAGLRSLQCGAERFAAKSHGGGGGQRRMCCWDRTAW